MSEVTFTDQNFAEEVENAKGVTLVDFWAPWCGPCRVLGPTIEAVAEDFAGKAKVGKINIDENSATAQKFGVMSIPTIIIFKDGKEVDKIVGARPKEEIAEKITSQL